MNTGSSRDLFPNFNTWSYSFNNIEINAKALSDSIPDTTESHNVGEVWATMLWDLTWAYVNKYGYDDNKYTGTGGNNKVMRLVLDAIKLQPCIWIKFIWDK